MQNYSDEVILKQIKQLFKQKVRNDNIEEMRDKLAELYSKLSFAHSYTLQELFPKIESDYKVTDQDLAVAKCHSMNAQQKWTADGTGTGIAYFSCREAFRDRTGIDIGREYDYPDKMTPQEFQESFRSTRLTKEVDDAFTAMALTALIGCYDYAVPYKIFLEKERPTAATLLESAYHKFWQKNADIFGYENLKNIKNFSDMSAFLMGVASEIPLDDILAYLYGAGGQLEKNDVRIKKNFNTASSFRMTDKTWNKHVKPVLTKGRTRYNTNIQLRKILKDKSLSSAEKQTQLRETVARYREESKYKAPNAKVGAALKKYLPPKKEGGR